MLFDDLGPKLLDMRKAAGLTQPELAKKIGVDPTMVSHVENGRRRPGPDTLEAWVEACGFRATTLFAKADADVIHIAVEPEDVELMERFGGLGDESKLIVKLLVDVLPELSYEYKQILRNQLTMMAPKRGRRRGEGPA